jgi:hypothetical protein
MAFDDVVKQMGGAAYLSLAEDGQSVIAMFLAEPEYREDVFRGNIVPRAIFPLMLADGGLYVWPVSKRTMLKIKGNWARLQDRPCEITRHGAKNDTDTYYEIRMLDPDPELSEMASGIEDGEITEALQWAIADSDSGNASQKE